MNDINIDELYQKIESKMEFVFIDVREQYEFEESNLNAQLIPLGTLPSKLEELSNYKDKEIVIHCRSGARSANAKIFLVNNGFTKVRNLLGGILAWETKYGKFSKKNFSTS